MKKKLYLNLDKKDYIENKKNILTFMMEIIELNKKIKNIETLKKERKILKHELDRKLKILFSNFDKLFFSLKIKEEKDFYYKSNKIKEEEYLERELINIKKKLDRLL
ncbi:MAG: hypothetical protein QXG18_00450 [Candidatus Pacearchaeota archaeon]